LENAERYRTELEQQLKMVKEKCRQLPDSERQLKLLQSKRTELENEVAKWHSMYEKTRNDLEGQQDELKRLREETGKMKKQLQLAKFQVGEQDKLQKNCGVESLEREHNDLAARYDQIVSGLQKEKQLSSSLRQQLEQSEAHCRKLEAAMERTCPAELSVLDRDVALQRSEEPPNQLKERIRDLEAQLSDYRIRLGEESKQHAECRSQLRTVSQTVLAQQQELLSINDGPSATTSGLSAPTSTTVPVAKPLGPQVTKRRVPPASAPTTTASSPKLAQSTTAIPEKSRGILKKTKSNDPHLGGSPAKVQRRDNNQPWSAADPKGRAPVRRLGSGKEDEQCAQQ
jgi:hypothetical protein